MDSPHSLFSLLMLRQFLSASGRLWSIMAMSNPGRGFPALRRFLDLIERIAHDPSIDNVGPALVEFLDEIDRQCPGVTDAILRPRTGADGPDHPGMGIAPAEATEG